MSKASASILELSTTYGQTSHFSSQSLTTVNHLDASVHSGFAQNERSQELTEYNSLLNMLAFTETGCPKGMLTHLIIVQYNILLRLVTQRWKYKIVFQINMLFKQLTTTRIFAY